MKKGILGSPCLSYEGAVTSIMAFLGKKKYPAGHIWPSILPFVRLKESNRLGPHGITKGYSCPRGQISPTSSFPGTQFTFFWKALNCFWKHLLPSYYQNLSSHIRWMLSKTLSISFSRQKRTSRYPYITTTTYWVFTMCQVNASHFTDIIDLILLV